MIDRRLIGLVDESKKHIRNHVVLQWLSMICNVIMVFTMALLLRDLLEGLFVPAQIVLGLLIVTSTVLIRFVCVQAASLQSFKASEKVKRVLRERIYTKLLKLGASYHERISTAEVVQISVEGVEQLETYFGKYLPQLFYSLLAPLTLFLILSFISLKSALILLLCVPLIPVSIVAVQRFAKKLLAKYWGIYTDLGDGFLENLQGLTTLKIYQADQYKNDEMNVQAEHFRKITMRVLSMQLNSIIVMDFIAYGGAALGIIMALHEYMSGAIGFVGCFVIVLLAADFFIPLRQLGSFFHIAMNGMAASGKIFRLLDMEEPAQGERSIDADSTEILCRQLDFGYDAERQILFGLNLSFPRGSFTALVGASGSGKSTIAALLTGQNKGYTGSISIGGIEHSQLSERSLMENITLVRHNSYLFAGTVRQNLLMAQPDADDRRLWKVLEQVRLAEFLRSEQGLDTLLLEKAANLSGGQCQRLALARALLHDTPIYIFDEITSNIDVESENDIMKVIRGLAQEKTMILISHRLANVEMADRIYVLEKGHLAEQGKHAELLARQGVYAELYIGQQELENYAYTRNREVANT